MFYRLGILNNFHLVILLDYYLDRLEKLKKNFGIQIYVMNAVNKIKLIKLIKLFEFNQLNNV
jgi:hypothetical protein